jgi:hypothetical protein
MFKPDKGRLMRMIVAYEEKRKNGDRVRRARSGAMGVEGLSTEVVKLSVSYRGVQEIELA